MIEPVPTEVVVDIDAPVATVTMSRPQAMNAITPTMLVQLQAAFETVRDHAEVRVAVLTGAGRAFSAGVDLKAIRGARLDGGSVGGLLDQPARNLIETIRTIPKVVIAKVNGYCFTGALELALACDVIVAAHEATFGDTHAKWGLRPTWGMSQRLPAAVGLARARALSYRAASFSGRQAEEWGLAAAACGRAELDEMTETMARQIADNSPGSLAAYKDLYRFAAEQMSDAGLAYEASATYAIDDTDERIAGFR
ncbi:MAG: enoyl-CoA hydratase/isomerase family protein [Actinomycetota bacterium]|nr:enoyl-CoA hydratase/isomerase family protein [Actinomycetota bacterium]